MAGIGVAAPSARADVGYDREWTAEGCWVGDQPVDEGPECQVSTSADRSTGRLHASHVAFGRTTGATGIAAVERDFVQTSTAAVTFSIPVNVARYDLHGGSGLAAVLLGPGTETCSNFLGRCVIDFDGWTHGEVTFELRDDEGTPGETVTVLVYAVKSYYAYPLGITIWPGTNGQPVPICAPYTWGEACSPVDAPIPATPWLGVGVAIGSPPVGGIEAVVGTVAVTPES